MFGDNYRPSDDNYLYDYTTIPMLVVGLCDYFIFYNTQRFHKSLGYLTLAQVHFASQLPVYVNQSLTYFLSFVVLTSGPTII